MLAFTSRTTTAASAGASTAAFGGIAFESRLRALLKPAPAPAPAAAVITHALEESVGGSHAASDSRLGGVASARVPATPLPEPCNAPSHAPSHAPIPLLQAAASHAWLFDAAGDATMGVDVILDLLNPFVAEDGPLQSSVEMERDRSCPPTWEELFPDAEFGEQAVMRFSNAADVDVCDMGEPATPSPIVTATNATANKRGIFDVDLISPGTHYDTAPPAKRHRAIKSPPIKTAHTAAKKRRAGARQLSHTTPRHVQHALAQSASSAICFPTPAHSVAGSTSCPQTPTPIYVNGHCSDTYYTPAQVANTHDFIPAQLPSSYSNAQLDNSKIIDTTDISIAEVEDLLKEFESVASNDLFASLHNFPPTPATQHNAPPPEELSAEEMDLLLMGILSTPSGVAFDASYHALEHFPPPSGTSLSATLPTNPLQEMAAAQLLRRDSAVCFADPCDTDSGDIISSEATPGPEHFPIGNTRPRSDECFMVKDHPSLFITDSFSVPSAFLASETGQHICRWDRWESTCMLRFDSAEALQLHVVVNHARREGFCLWAGCYKKNRNGADTSTAKQPFDRRKDKALEHIRTHTRYKPFPCSLGCQTAYSRRDALQSHYQHHKDIDRVAAILLARTVSNPRY